MQISVSIIIPVFNAKYTLEKLLNSLTAQNYNKEQFEIIAIDNNSKDNSVEIIEKFNNVKLLNERNIQSSYAARNVGIQQSKHDILAFIDSDCIASKNWLNEGVKKLTGSNADLVGGDVRFFYSKYKSGFEIFDSISNMQIKKNIYEQNVAKTANLFIRKELFNDIGLFNSKLKSGGDVEWTWKATQKGYKLVFSENAYVLHPSRNAKELLKKQIRIGRGQVPVWKEKGFSKPKIFKMFLLGFCPTSFGKISRLIDSKNIKVSLLKKTSVYFASYIAQIFTNIGRILYFLK